MNARLKKGFRCFAVVVGLLVFGWVGAPWLLLVDSGPHVVDALIVLGGEPQTRPYRAAEVFQEIVSGRQKTETLPSDLRPPTANSESPASNLRSPPTVSEPAVRSPWSSGPLVVVSGNGDCEDVRRQLEAKGVPAAAIVTECASRTTRENALLSVKLLRAHGVTNAVIVTSWYHSRRALACFQSAAPEIAFYCRPTQRPPGFSVWFNRYQRGRSVQEYAKILYYWVAHGIPPGSERTSAVQVRMSSSFRQNFEC